MLNHTRTGCYDTDWEGEHKPGLVLLPEATTMLIMNHVDSNSNYSLCSVDSLLYRYRQSAVTRAFGRGYLRGGERAQMYPVLHRRSSSVVPKNLAGVGLNIDLLQLGVTVLVRVSLYRRAVPCGRRAP